MVDPLPLQGQPTSAVGVQFYKLAFVGIPLEEPNTVHLAGIIQGNLQGWVLICYKGAIKVPLLWTLPLVLESFSSPFPRVIF